MIKDKLGKPLQINDSVVASDNNKMLKCTIIKFFDNSYVILKTPTRSMVTKHCKNIIKI